MKTADIQRLSLKAGRTNKTDDKIAQMRNLIQILNEKRRRRLDDVRKQLQNKQLQPCIDQNNIYVQGYSIERPQSRIKKRIKSNSPIILSPPPKQKNQGIGQMDKVAFDKKFKNYLNHKQQFLEKAKKRQQAIREKRRKIKQGANQIDYYNQDEILSNTGSQYQFRDAQDMEFAFQNMATGRKARKGGVHLFYAEKFEFAFRLLEFQLLLSQMQSPQQALISKQALLNYLFDEPMVMMLYSVNPYLVADEIAEFETQTPNLLCFQQFSSFLLTDREPTYFLYTYQNLMEARQIGRGLKCAPIVGKWIDQTGIFEDLINIFNSVDMCGNEKVQRSVLAKKISLLCEKKRIMDFQVVQIVNINKLVPLRRLIYQIEHEIGGSQMISKDQFENFLHSYHRLPTPQKDKLITKLIMAGKYDTSYIYIISQEVLDFIKQVFKAMEKFAQYFVKKQKFIQKVVNHKKYQILRNNLVRAQGNRYVPKQTVEDTLKRLLNEADAFIDIEQILDFFSNRGRPKVIEYHVYLANLQRQLAILQEEEMLKMKKFQETGEEPSTSSDQQFQNQLKKKKIARKHEKIALIRQNFKYDYTKKFNVTIPVTFGFDQRDKNKKISIREQKLKQMLQQKRLQQQQQLKPIPIKQVPKHVKQPLYQKMMRDQERERKQRLQRFRLEIQNSMVPMPERLTKKHQTQIHCDFARQPFEFVARPMPWYCEVNLLDRINKKKQQRRQRILQQIINRHHDADLPQGVLRMLERHEQLAQKRQKNRSQSTTSVGQCTFIPKISQHIPDFKAIHDRLDVDLEIAKQNKQHFHPQPFSFQNREKKSRSHIHCVPNLDGNYKLTHSRGQYRKDQNNVQIKPTLKFIGLVQKRKSQRQAKKKEEQQIQQKNQIRKMRQQKFAPQVRRILQKNENDLGKSRQQMLQKIKQFQKEEKKKARDYQNQMIDIYTKVWNRPLLIENNQYGQNDIKNNPRLRQEQFSQQVVKNTLKETAAREKLSKKSDKRPENKRKIDKDYEQKRKRAVEQPPGQYLIQQDEELPLPHHHDDHGVEFEDQQYDDEYDDDQFEEEFLQHNGLRTS